MDAGRVFVMPGTQRAAIGEIVHHVLNRANRRRKVFYNAAGYEGQEKMYLTPFPFPGK